MKGSIPPFGRIVQGSSLDCLVLLFLTWVTRCDRKQSRVPLSPHVSPCGAWPWLLHPILASWPTQMWIKVEKMMDGEMMDREMKRRGRGFSDTSTGRVGILPSPALGRYR
jgi:hypothetical protein